MISNIDFFPRLWMKEDEKQQQRREMRANFIGDGGRGMGWV